MSVKLFLFAPDSIRATNWYYAMYTTQFISASILTQLAKEFDGQYIPGNLIDDHHLLFPDESSAAQFLLKWG